MEIVKWGEIAFFVSPSAIRGVRDLSLSASCETEDTTESNESFAKLKNAKGYEVSMKAILNAMLGEDVQTTAIMLTEAARQGTTGYLYCAGTKLFPCNFIMASASVSNIQMSPNGTWVHCEVQLTLKQCSKYEGDTTPTYSGGGGAAASEPKKQSVKTESTSDGLFFTQTAKRIEKGTLISSASAFSEKIETTKKVSDAETVVKAADKVASVLAKTTTTTTNTTKAQMSSSLSSAVSSLANKIAISGTTPKKTNGFTEAKTNTTATSTAKSKITKVEKVN